MTSSTRRPPTEALGRLESKVMDIVWRSGHVTAREVCDRLRGNRERAYTTIMTTMDRLHRKGLLIREKEGLAWRYAPTMTREEFDRSVADSLARGILSAHGEVGLAAFVDVAAQVDGALLDRLAALVAARRKGQK